MSIVIDFVLFFVPHYRPHANDPVYHPVKMATVRLFCMLRAIWLVKKRAYLYLSCRYIFMTQSQSHVTYIGVSSDLTQREISVKGEQVGDVILIRLSLDIYSLFIDTFCDETHCTRTSFQLLRECFTFGPEQNLHFWC